MSRLPIFDSLTHPALDGNWLHPRWNGRNSFAQVVAEMDEADVRWALAVAMDPVAGYDPAQYPAACAEHPGRLFPVAFFRPDAEASADQLQEELGRLKEQGYCGIKLHPRRGCFDFAHPGLPRAIQAAHDAGMFSMLCTYFPSADAASRNCGVESLQRLLFEVPEARLMLMHSGGVQLLEVVEMTRPFKQVLLDLSFTLCEYAGSSIDLDLKFAMRRHAHRVCLGSDSPEYTPLDTRQRFEELSADLPVEKREKVAWRNLLEFTGIPDPS